MCQPAAGRVEPSTIRELCDKLCASIDGLIAGHHSFKCVPIGSCGGFVCWRTERVWPPHSVRGSCVQRVMPERTFLDSAYGEAIAFGQTNSHAHLYSCVSSSLRFSVPSILSFGLALGVRVSVCVCARSFCPFLSPV